jgi:hypothetical protein
MYFQSEIYNNIYKKRKDIIAYASEKYSWEKIGEKTLIIYKKIA